MTQAVNHVALLPLYAAAGTAILVLLADLTLGRFRTAAGVLGGLATAVCAAVTSSAGATFCTGAACSWVPSRPAATVAVLFAALTVGVLALSVPALSARALPPGEYAFLLACAMTGGVTVGYAGDLITLIVGLETLTLPLYVLVGLRRPAAALTFFVISVVATAVALMGAALVYAASGALHLAGLRAAVLAADGGPMHPVATVGTWLLVIGFAFKVAGVPLHAWAAPTYDGAPMPVAAYLSTASKLGGVIGLTVIVARLDTGPLLAVLAVATMTVGNLVALRQTRMVRLLAWSSVAQAGYVLAPLAAGADGVRAALAYAVLFVTLEFVAFGAIIALRPPDADGGTLNDYRGAARRSPWRGAAFVLAVAGLAGLPPGLAGLFAKVTIVGSLIGDGWGWLAAVVALNAVVALAYYVRAAAVLYAGPTGIAVADLRPPVFAVRWPVATAVIVAAAVAVALGFAPQLLFDALTA
ncbi:NADH-quinone oxidoreductase subunit N [Mangrovihabitans endophyticus]|uniref:NADH-quinone oxidoreductase subunit N n=1 Tax=Mangrovihabitans endophyticus TaxID=1751298 RepID=A0A8J3C1X3_9ACTN|nr:proton-conducting transporter membrane subunit [Mangrovihabitans endophyticus]GGK96532.1 NADH-quinone oxidoreductase subunit N [Mangrovihabitans endophyticus]